MKPKLRIAVTGALFPLAMIGAFGSAEAPPPPTKPQAPAGQATPGVGVLGAGTVGMSSPQNKVVMGVNIASLNEQDKLFYKRSTGAIVESVLVNSPAQRAGLQRNDLIIGFDSKVITVATDLTTVLQSVSPGETHSVLLVRAGKEQTVSVSF